MTIYLFLLKVNLNRPCPFWPDDGACALKDCSVSACKEVWVNLIHFNQVHVHVMAVTLLCCK